jgi:hypothetical protein
MAWINPTAPNISDYRAFIYDNVEVKQVSLPDGFYGAGTLVNSDTTLTIVSRQTGNLSASAPVYDGNGAIGAGVTIAKTLTGTGGVGTYEMSAAAGADEATPEMIVSPNQWLVWTLNAALEVVSDTISEASALMYTLAVYNLAADRLFNYAPDVSGQTFFAEQRKLMKLTVPKLGVPASVNDQGTAVGILNPEQLRTLTLFDLQTLKTPWGREYMGIAQNYGSNIWGLT